MRLGTWIASRLSKEALGEQPFRVSVSKGAVDQVEPSLHPLPAGAAKEKLAVRPGRWRAVLIEVTLPKGFGGKLRWVWGTDIWINGIPMVKLMIGANILMWILMWRSR